MGLDLVVIVNGLLTKVVSSYGIRGIVHTVRVLPPISPPYIGDE